MQDSEENNAGKGGNTDDQHFLIFPPCFQKALSRGASKVIVEKGLKDHLDAPHPLWTENRSYV